MDEPLSVSHSASGLEPANSAQKRRHRWIWVIILLLFGLLFFWVYKQHSASTAAPAGGSNRRGAMAGPVPVTVATATQGSIGVYLNAIGTVTPLYTDTITSQVTGVITAVHYREGQVVHKGDPLIDIDSRTYEAQLAQAEGMLERDQSLLAEAQMDQKRYQDAWAKNAIPRQTLEDQEKVVLQDQGTVKNDEGTVQYDKVEVAFCHITAPIDGRVGLRLADPGNLVTANSSTALVVVTQIQPVTVIFTLAEDSLSQVLDQMRGGKTLSVEAFDRTNTKLIATGRLIAVNNQIDTVTGTVQLRAQFDNSKGQLFPNEFVNTRLLVKTLDNQTLVPSSAIQHNGAKDFVYLIQGLTPKAAGNSTGKANSGQGSGHQGSGGKSGNGGGNGASGGSGASNQPVGKAVQTTVKSGISDQGNTIVISGLKPGDVVANSSFQKLIDGSPVTLSTVTIPSTDTDTTEAAP
ncbi:MAG: efflux RND transporter periplasmic adaptor subunit [Terracidiphilus sp.]|jgi:multidrug efflux system membrane fusion protein